MRGARRSYLLAAIALIACLALLGAPQPAMADDANAEAQRHFQVGLSLLDEHAWDSALAEFLRSRELFPTRNAVRNAAVCLRELGRYDEALDTYEELLRRFGGELPAPDRRAVDDDVAAIAKHVGTIAVDSQPTGAAVVIDGRGRGVTPLAKPVRVTAGAHVVRVVTDGFAPFEARMVVAAGAAETVHAALSAVAAVGTAHVRESTGRVFEVLVDGSVVGTTPWEGTLATGDHTFALRGEADLGAPLRVMTIATGQRTDVVLAAELLAGELRVEPTPEDARVFIDGREVGRGVWSGSLPSGEHVVGVAAAWHEPFHAKVVVSSRTPQAIRPTLERIRRFYGELFGGIAVAPQTRVRGIDGCESASCLGNPGGARLGLKLTPRVGLELFYFGIDLERESSRAATATVAGVQLTTPKYTQTASTGGSVFGISAHYELLDRTPLTFRLWTGLMSGTTSTYGVGQFGEYDVSRGPSGVSYQSLVFAPEVRFGYRFTRAITVDAGAAAMFFVVPEVASEAAQTQTARTPPPSAAFSHGLGYAFPLTLAIRVYL